MLLELALTKAFGAALHYQRSKSFGFPNQGAQPAAGLVQSRDGRLYGTTLYGGALDRGTVFGVNADGSGYSMLHDFSSGIADGHSPRAALTEDSEGQLYGTTSRGAAADGGTLFRLNRDGTGFRTLHEFESTGDPFGAPRVLEGNDGLVYVMTRQVLFKIAKDGTGYSVVHEFQDPSDVYPADAQLLQGSDGKLYGVRAVIFSIQPDGSDYTVLHRFNRQVNGFPPSAGLIFGDDGQLYGTTENGGAFGYGTLYRVRTNGDDFQVMHSFEGHIPNGLLLPREGTLFGVGWTFGADSSGIVYKISQGGTSFEVLQDFSYAQGQSNGLQPQGTLVLGTNGQLYGNATLGGAWENGAIFSLNPSGTDFVVVRPFGDGPGDAGAPASLTAAADGFLYGIAAANTNYSENVAFRMKPDGSEYQLLRVRSLDASYSPVGNLAQGTNGALYSIAFPSNASTPRLIRFNQDGTGATILKEFGNSQPYEWPGLVISPDGVLFGTTFAEGTNQAGALYTVHQDGTGYAILHHFGAGPDDGSSPNQPLVGKSGALFGTTASGPTGSGTVYRVESDGTGYRILHQFGSTPEDGAGPQGLLEGIDGFIYGITFGGGNHEAGTVFRLRRDGSEYQIVHTVDPERGDLSFPIGALVEGTDERLYGTASDGLFSIDRDGGGYEVVHRFTGEQGDGLQPNGVLLLTQDGDLCGTTTRGGDLGLGTVFRLLAGPVMLRLSASVRSNDAIEVEVSGAAAGLACRLESSASFGPGAAWTPALITNAPIDGRFRFSATNISATSPRFYRAASP